MIKKKKINKQGIICLVKLFLAISLIITVIMLGAVLVYIVQMAEGNPLNMQILLGLSILCLTWLLIDWVLKEVNINWR